MALALGDRHNGQSVARVGLNQIFKPRTIYWEWLFLGANSPFREKVSSLAGDSSSPLDGLASLDFTFEDSTCFSGFVERFEAIPMRHMGVESSYKVGGVFATAAWFGITDLHFENVIHGLDRDGIFKFCPIDIESLFEKLELFSQTQLVAAKGTRADLSGAYSLVSAGPNIAALICGFIKGITFFRASENEIDDAIINSDGFNDAPIRVVLRPTGEYLDLINCVGTPQQPLIKEEMIQIEAGDVPYFYRYAGSDLIHFKDSDGLERVVSSELDQTKLLKPQYSLDRGFQRNIDSEWIKTAICQISRTLDPRLDKIYMYDGIKVIYQGSDIFFSNNNEWRVRCERALPSYSLA